MDILILAAGFGTRLYPITINLPKALIKLNNKPIIEHSIEKLNMLNPENIYILSNNRFYPKFLDWLKSYNNTTYNIYYFFSVSGEDTIFLTIFSATSCSLFSSKDVFGFLSFLSPVSTNVESEYL